MFELRGLPLLLFRAWEVHSDNLLREYVLATGPGYPYSISDVAAAKQARDAVSTEAARAEEAAGEDVRALDVMVPVPSGLSLGAYSTLQAVLEHGTEMARRGDFLTMPGLPEIVALRNWVCDEAVSQSAGAAPRAWDPSAAAPTEVPLAQWPAVETLPADRGWLVGDDQNRIIAASGPALTLLGWSDSSELTGQRILAVIPPALREAHVAAFTHATVTDHYRLLGTPLAVHAWTRAGGTVPVTLTLEKHTAQRGRTVFVAWLDARSET